jgi:proteasome lid subunit RPN8/RPN11
MHANAARSSEECWLLVGRRRGRIWHARQIGRCAGEPASVEFDGLATLRREERRRDVVGFLHTHPATATVPSRRDLDTMRAWVGALGKPLLCVIEGVDGLAGWRFDDDESDGERLLAVELFPRGVLIGVDAEQ